MGEGSGEERKGESLIKYIGWYPQIMLWAENEVSTDYSVIIPSHTILHPNTP